MQHISKSIYAIFCAAVLLTNCKGKDGDPGPAGPAGPAGPSLSGNIVGFVNPVDEDGDPLSKAGVTVTITSVTPQVTQTTDATGRYEFANLPNGTYNLSYSRTGLGLYKVFGYGLVGGNQPGLLNTTYLSQVSSTMVSNLTASTPQFNSNSGYYTELSATLSNPTSTSNYRRMAVYASATTGVNSTTGTLIGEYFVYQGNGGGQTGTVQVSRAALTAAGFATGSRVYAIAYGSPDYYNVSYTEIATGRVVLTALNPVGSREVSFIAP